MDTTDALEYSAADFSPAGKPASVPSRCGLRPAAWGPRGATAADLAGQLGASREEGLQAAMVAPPLLFVFICLLFLNNPCALLPSRGHFHSQAGPSVAPGLPASQGPAGPTVMLSPLSPCPLLPCDPWLPGLTSQAEIPGQPGLQTPQERPCLMGALLLRD